MPREKTETTTVFKVQELEGEARAKALEWLAQGATDHDWHEHVIEDAKTIAELLGITVKHIYYNGFWSQGDGACFVGAYSYAKGAPRAIKAHAPNDAELYRIATELQRIERRNFYQLSANITKRSHHYQHENTVEIETDEGRKDDAGDTGALAIVLRDFMRWIYKALEAEHDYLTSEEQLIESADANDYEFDEHGNPA